jgi:hypothetical protein
MRFRSYEIAAAVLALVALASPPASAQSSPLSRSFNTAPLSGGTTQPPSLWYYGPSYSLYYDRPPAGAVGTGPAYRPSLRYDPYYGPDYLHRVERGQRFGPLSPWPQRFHDR